MTFINRIEELSTLENEYISEKSNLVIIYGRRRVGKTSLIREFLSKHNDSIYFLATEEKEENNLRNFKYLVSKFINNKLLNDALIDWYDIFNYLVEYKTSTKKIIVIDEFQYLGLKNTAFPSVMQKIWDLILKDNNVMLILCGSLVNLMISQTLNYSSPLYGRRTAQIKLKQISFLDYHRFYPNLKFKELLLFYGVTGGVPRYIEMFNNCNDIYEAISNNILNKNSFLYEEPYFLLQKEVSEIGSYFSLIKSIAKGCHKLQNIAVDLNVKQTNLTKYLNVLIDLDLIEREVPITEYDPSKSKKGIYKIKDYFILFWFKYVYPNINYLETNNINYVLDLIKNSYEANYMPYIYEEIARTISFKFAVDKKIYINRIGRYWDNKTLEIDIVGLNDDRNIALFGECKYSKHKVGLSVLYELENKVKTVNELNKHTNKYYILFSISGFSDDLILLSKERNDLFLIKGIDEYDE